MRRRACVVPRSARSAPRPAIEPYARIASHRIASRERERAPLADRSAASTARRSPAAARAVRRASPSAHRRRALPKARRRRAPHGAARAPCAARARSCAQAAKGVLSARSDPLEPLGIRIPVQPCLVRSSAGARRRLARRRRSCRCTGCHGSVRVRLGAAPHALLEDLGAQLGLCRRHCSSLLARLPIACHEINCTLQRA